MIHRRDGSGPSYWAALREGRISNIQVGRRSRTFVQVGQGFTVEPDESNPANWIVQLVGYHYAIVTRDARELLTLQWHPSSAHPEFHQHPHLHIGAELVRPGLQIAPKDVHKVHVPTGYVTLPMFVRMLIEEFSVEPLRDDWDARLRELEDELSDDGQLPDQ